MQVISFCLGSRGVKSARELWKQTSNLCCPKMVCTDNWDSYRKVIPKQLHAIGKDGTCSIESFNAVVRLRLKRFNRKTKCCSKSKKITEASLLLLFDNWNKQKRKEYYAKIN